MIKILALFLFSTLSSLLFGQTLKQIEQAKKQETTFIKTHKITPPITVRAAFAKEFPGIPVNWERTRGHFEANYIKDGKNMSVLYGDDANKIESELIIPKSQLPEMIMNYINTHYIGQDITKTSIIKISNQEENYEVELKGLHILFTKEGKYIKTLKD